MIIQIGPNAVAMDAAGLEEFLDILDAEIAEARRCAEELAHAGAEERRKIQARINPDTYKF